MPPAVAIHPLFENVRKSAGTPMSPAIDNTATTALERPSVRRHRSAPTISGAAIAIISPNSPTLKKVSLEK